MAIDIFLRRRIGPRVVAALERLGTSARAELVESLSVPGSVVPFVVAPPGEPSYNWDDELTGGISYTVADGGAPALTMRSAGVSKYAHPGKIIAADAEQGSFWSGWAYDSRGARWVKCAPAHMVAPRPHMRPALERMREGGLAAIATEMMV